MTQKYDIVLNSKIKEFCRRFDITRTNDNDSEVFEDFSNYIIASNLIEGEVDNFKMISTNKTQGIDGIIIAINNKLILDEDDLSKFENTDTIKIKIGFVQATTEKSFSEEKFGAFTDTVVKFLTEEINIEPYSNIYKALFDEDNNFVDKLAETPRLSLFFVSGRTAHNTENLKINLEKNKIVSRTDIENKFSISDFLLLQKDEIKEKYDRISKFHTVQLKMEYHTPLPSMKNIEKSLLAMISFKELKKMIATADNTLKEKLFVENVRNYIGNTPVNLDIRKTLNEENKYDYFPFLNNGLVIICDKLEHHKSKINEFILTFPRIINGCQTTNELFKKYQENINDDLIENIRVVAKIIGTQDNELKKMIIHAANNQNSIEKDLQSLNDFHEKIETYFLGKENNKITLYFERLRGQYSNITPPYKKINIETLAKIFISVFLNKPHEMKSKSISFIENLQKEGKIFNSQENIPVYYFCALLWYWFNYFLVNNKIVLRSKTMDMHILMVCNIFLENKKIISIEEKIEYLNNYENAVIIFNEVITILNQKDYLFERRGFYSNNKTQRLILEVTNAAQ